MANIKKYPINYNEFVSNLNTNKNIKVKNPVFLFDPNNYLAINKYLNYQDNLINIPVVDLQNILHLFNLKDYSSALNKFTAFLNYKKENNEITNEYAIKHNFYNPLYNLKPGWISCMSQGLFLSVLIRVCQIDSSYISIRDKLYDNIKNNFYDLDISTCYGICCEEYPSKNANGVLNGFLFLVISLIEYSELINKPFCNKLNSYILYIENSFDYYFQYHGSSFYDLQGRLANEKYHYLHLEQLYYISNYSDVLNKKIQSINKEFIPKKASFGFIRKITNLINTFRYKFNV